jgi:hypothetical protein
MRALVSGAIASKPGSSGETWLQLSYFFGLRRLGVDVRFVEQLPGASDEARAWFDVAVDRFGIRATAVLLHDETVPDDLLAFAGEADLLVNYAGHLTVEPLRSAPRVKAYVDGDPGYTQIWQASGIPGARLEGHDVHFTVGLNVGRPGCAIPRVGIDWKPLPPPVVLDDWPVAHARVPERLTTIGTLRNPYGTLEWEGTTYGSKVHELRRFAELPQLVEQRLELALAIDDADHRDRELLERNGWHLVDPATVTATPDAYRDYIRGSWAELSVAQSVYVHARSGWLSERTARYLASGRPALVQDTGVGDVLPTGEGLLTFATLDDAAAGVRELARDYERHSAAARAFAEAHLDSDRVLARLLEEAGLG